MDWTQGKQLLLLLRGERRHIAFVTKLGLSHILTFILLHYIQIIIIIFRINYMLSTIVGLAKANNRGVFKYNPRLTQPILGVQRGNS